jgi:hypothetical protein
MNRLINHTAQTFAPTQGQANQPAQPGEDCDGEDASERAKTPPLEHPPAPGKKLSAGCYIREVRPLIEIARRRFTARIINVDAFPDSATREQWAKDCWREACSAGAIQYKLPSELQTLVRA